MNFYEIKIRILCFKLRLFENKIVPLQAENVLFCTEVSELN
jgi:hypothetical protein